MATLPNPVKFTPYVVSTITANGSVGADVRINVFFEHAAVVMKGAPGIVWLQYGTERERGEYPKKRKVGVRRKFGDQVSFYMWLATGHTAHVKLFENGNLHMTGLRRVEEGHAIQQSVAAEIRRIAAENDVHVLVDPDAAGLGASDQFVIRMINCDFSIPFHVRRRELHQLLSVDPYNTVCMFQPGTYPGVKLEYYWSSAVDSKRDGVCRCTKLRVHRRRVTAMTNHPHPDVECNCKKVTVAVFESGRVLITGANDFNQVDEAYAFITSVMAAHANDLQRRLPPPPPPVPKPVASSRGRRKAAKAVVSDATGD
jgi:hypothetical protein